MRTLADDHPIAVVMSGNRNAERFFARELRRIEIEYHENEKRKRGIKPQKKRDSPAKRIAERQRLRNLAAKGDRK
ncbi:hypothetical protein [Burkholderia gladioli]|nr:hypothetical protein [Burkholderia gladioli]MBU9196031.1 hypothetical protein [Burkholderia gladioli]MBU9268170.1 hypothetical protein [Burkholderia gladioli]MBU9424486.1 hypothetical protein [Burkholderia gladioli]MCH7272597.1 hypothetical protein [Burkholderia gladioli]MDN8061546.1 hypothetical protein [Burkholderia gladioli]